jgi:hypothetical protein
MPMFLKGFLCGFCIHDKAFTVIVILCLLKAPRDEVKINDAPGRRNYRFGEYISIWDEKLLECKRKKRGGSTKKQNH